MVNTPLESEMITMQGSLYEATAVPNQDLDFQLGLLYVQLNGMAYHQFKLSFHNYKCTHALYFLFIIITHVPYILGMT